MPNDPENDLNKEDRSEKIEDRVREAVKLLNNVTSLVLLEAKVSEPVNVLNMEFFSAELPLNVNNPASALNREFFCAMLEAMVIEPVGLTAHAVAAPACSVQETGFVVEA